jgi:DNA-binding MarR family transcriptional regulator
MECICLIKDIYKAINAFEEQFDHAFGICINQGLVLCSLKGKTLSSSEIAEQIGLKFSHVSKLIKTVEDMGYIARSIGSSDKRYMNFELTEKGLALLNQIETNQIEIPEILQPIFKCRSEQTLQNIRW